MRSAEHSRHGNAVSLWLIALHRAAEMRCAAANRRWIQARCNGARLHIYADSAQIVLPGTAVSPLEKIRMQ